MERVIDRFDQYMKLKGLNDNKVTVMLGLSVGTVGKSRREGRDMSKKLTNKVLAYFNDLDETWLLTGNGDMICEPRQPEPVPEPEVPVEEQRNPTIMEKLAEAVVTSEESIHKLVGEMSKAHDLLAKSQEQIDRILSMLEDEKASNKEFKNALLSRK